MREAGLSVRDLALYFGASESAIERTLEELRTERGAEKFGELLPPDVPAKAAWKQQQAGMCRRLALYRANTPKAIAADMGLHANTVSAINLGQHPLQARREAARSPQTYWENRLQDKGRYMDS